MLIHQISRFETENGKSRGVVGSMPQPLVGGGDVDEVSPRQWLERAGFAVWGLGGSGEWQPPK